MFGSEFKHPSYFNELLQDHPNWKKLKDILLKGASFPLSPISNEDRLNDLHYHFHGEKHQSATKNKQVLDKLIEEDIHQGFALPIPIQLYKHLPNASISPLGCKEQETINDKG
jgi:hypothetical protein